MAPQISALVLWIQKSCSCLQSFIKVIMNKRVYINWGLPLMPQMTSLSLRLSHWCKVAMRKGVGLFKYGQCANILQNELATLGATCCGLITKLLFICNELSLYENVCYYVDCVVSV